MPLSWNEIKDRAIKFSKEWENETSEDAEAKSFWDDFFQIFGVSRRRIATFETKVTKENSKNGYIDLLWKGNLLVEHKSAGKDLNLAYKQAVDYFPGLKDYELPKFIIVCNFQKFRIINLDDSTEIEFELSQLVNYVEVFGFIAGYESKIYKIEEQANIEAAQLMGKLHDSLKDIGYSGHHLEIYLVRLLFCLFAEDTTIFKIRQFQDYIEQRTNIDGSDLASKIQDLFQVLNTPKDKRFKNLDNQLNDFEYVNGKIFEEILPNASFDSKMRETLIDACKLNWSFISPEIFGSMFQSVMNPKQRRDLGAHYTSEENILKLIKPLFIDDLYEEFEKVKSNKKQLKELHNKLGTLKFLDPACGCGNFLVVTYRELRLLELEILKVLQGKQQVINIEQLILVDVDQFFGIEYEEFPAQIAQVALWLVDHQMNQLIGNYFGIYFARIPLKKSAKIVHGNALRLNWSNLDSNYEKEIYSNETNIYEVNEPQEHYGTLNIFTKKININPNHYQQNNNKETNSMYDFIIGNPPFIGKKEQNSQQKNDLEIVFKGIKGVGVLDYVTCWYLKAAQIIQNTTTKVGFVSTNSITQGEQVGILWNILYNFYNIKIHFAHQTFVWKNEAKGNATVHCVIVGFANFDTNKKLIYEYENIKTNPIPFKANNINPYLVEGKDSFISARRKPICNVSEINYGSFALDDGNYTITENEKNDIVKENPNSSIFLKPFIGGRELLHSENRYCIWLLDAKPEDIRNNSLIKNKVEAVRKWRATSNRENTKKMSETPTLFAEVRQPKTNYLAFPTLSSENRKYIPIAFLEPNIIASNQLYVIPNATLKDFGILTSMMHMSWIKSVCGKLESRYRYSSSIVYNNFPWPESINEKQTKSIEKAAQKVLDVRNDFPNNSLADLYDISAMPPSLIKAHQELDKAVDLAYRPQVFINETKRIEFLFELYEKYTADLFTKEKVKKIKKN